MAAPKLFGEPYVEKSVPPIGWLSKVRVGANRGIWAVCKRWACGQVRDRGVRGGCGRAGGGRSGVVDDGCSIRTTDCTRSIGPTIPSHRPPFAFDLFLRRRRILRRSCPGWRPGYPRCSLYTRRITHSDILVTTKYDYNRTWKYNQCFPTWGKVLTLINCGLVIKWKKSNKTTFPG